MSYTPGTVLTRKTPFQPPEEGEEKVDLTAYNEVEVIGQSPVETGIRSAEFVGQLSDTLSIKPTGETGFGQVIDRPYGELQRDYEVKTLPEPRRLERGEVTVVDPGPSPEEVFAQASPTPPSKPPTPVSPDAPSPEDVFAQQSQGA